ncbi:hypothetical protein AOA12_07010 [Microbacterium sp. No. 7]|nr:hypothetical protein AOA12_07010 [Microbacterium sp. No. 7]
MRNTAAAHEVQRLRAQLERVQGRRLDAPVQPAHPVLSELLPGRGLRPGAAYAVGSSMALLFALLAEPSQAGSWCAAIGMPHLGAEAAAHAGVELSRLVLIPDPGARWLAVTATVAEVVPVVAVRPAARASAAEVSRLTARLRGRGAVLLVQGAWPQAEATIDLADDPRWSGLGAGHGLLSARAVTLTVSSRRSPAPRRARLLLPAPDGTIAPAAERTAAVRMPEERVTAAHDAVVPMARAV